MYGDEFWDRIEIFQRIMRARDLMMIPDEQVLRQIWDFETIRSQAEMASRLNPDVVEALLKLPPHAIDIASQLAMHLERCEPYIERAMQQAMIAEKRSLAASAAYSHLVEFNNQYIQLYREIPEAVFDFERVNNQILNIDKLAGESLSQAGELLRGWAATHIAHVVNNISITQMFMRQVNIDQLAARYKETSRTQILFRTKFERYFASFNELGKKTMTVEDILAQPPSFLVDASRDVMCTGMTLRVLSCPEDEELIDDVDTELGQEKQFSREECTRLIACVSSMLLEKYEGAIARFEDKGRDYAGQTLYSLSGLGKGTMRKLAPKEEVEQHFPKERYGKDRKIYTQNGKLTHRAKLKYICRNVKDESGCEFIESSIDTFVETIHNYGKYHEEHAMSDEDLEKMISRTESMVIMLINKTGNN